MYEFDAVLENSPDPRLALRILDGVDEDGAAPEFDVVTDSPPVAKVPRIRPCIQGKADCFAPLAVDNRSCEFRDLSDRWASPPPFSPSGSEPGRAMPCHIS